MAPTICLAELPTHKAAANPYVRRRLTVHNNGIVKQQKLKLGQVSDSTVDGSVALSPPESPVWEAGCPTNSCVPTLASSPNVSARIPADPHEHWSMILTRREGLLNIVARTMALVRRNHVLQKRVNALRVETREFIRSVLNNPENKNKQIQKTSSSRKDSIVSSSTEEICSRPTPPPTPDSTDNLSHGISSVCSLSDFDSDTSSECEFDDSEVFRETVRVSRVVDL